MPRGDVMVGIKGSWLPALCSCWLLMLDLNLDRTSSDGVGLQKGSAGEDRRSGEPSKFGGVIDLRYGTIPPPGRPPPQPKNMFDNTIISVGHISQLFT